MASRQGRPGSFFFPFFLFFFFFLFSQVVVCDSGGPEALPWCLSVDLGWDPSPLVSHAAPASRTLSRESRGMRPSPATDRRRRLLQVGHSSSMSVLRPSSFLHHAARPAQCPVSLPAPHPSGPRDLPARATESVSPLEPPWATYSVLLRLRAVPWWWCGGAVVRWCCSVRRTQAFVHPSLHVVRSDLGRPGLGRRRGAARLGWTKLVKFARTIRIFPTALVLSIVVASSCCPRTAPIFITSVLFRQVSSRLRPPNLPSLFGLSSLDLPSP